MRVKILSGNQAGQVQEVDEVSGEHMLAFGFAERAPEPVAEAPPYVYDRDAIIAAAEQARQDREQREAQELEEREREAAERAIREQGSAGSAAGQDPAV